MRFSLLTLCLGFFFALNAQKKPLDHTVYDAWQSIGEKLISNDGKWVVYTINPQEGDNELVIQASDTTYRKSIPRGYNALITEDSRFAIFKIKPFYKDTREARIKKKRPDETPKDSLAIVEFGKDNVWKIARVKSYKTPEKNSGWVVYHLDKKPEAAKKPGVSDKKMVDSLTRVIDSLQAVIAKIPRKESSKDITDADEDDAASATADAGTDLILRNLITGEEKQFGNVVEYVLSKNGQKLVIEQSRDPKDSLGKTLVLCYDIRKGFPDTLSYGGNVFKNFTISEDGSQVAYLAEREAKPKDLQKFYKLWYYRDGMDSAAMLVDKFTTGMPLGASVSEFGLVSFSKSGKRLFFGTAPIPLPKDTTLVDIDLVKLDIWHYNDDYLQTTQLSRLRRDLQENFLAAYDLGQNKMMQLASKEVPVVIQSNEGDGDQFAGVTDFGKRVESQWTGNTKKDIYAINPNDGSQKLIKKDVQGIITPAYVSPTGKFIMWYDSKAKNYFLWDGRQINNISNKIGVPLYDEEHDSPSEPPPYGVMGWYDNDSAVFVYDRYDAWRIDLFGKSAPRTITKGRKDKTIYRYLRLDSTERFLTEKRGAYYRTLNKVSKNAGIDYGGIEGGPGEEALTIIPSGPYLLTNFVVPKNGKMGMFMKEDYGRSPDLFTFYDEFYKHPELGLRTPQHLFRLSRINPQQSDYTWGTAELFKWKAYNGKESEGIVYKPEGFDPKKKYPMICYFYETLSDGLYSYQAPSPTPSRLNIPFFVSRGYVVFAPDIHYSTGHPGRDAYNYVVSGARALVRQGFVDSARIGIQGQSWGGYQVAYLITATNLFKAAWAGAPVANMTSAYGGIRWESGLNRQFQYEKTQSRIGASLWEKPELYIENSPLFHLPKVKTPLVIMANDADGAVPWYQGIELFTAMRRLGKKVWMLNYNGEAHNLVERKNRKDIQIREQQFFDWLLKDEKPPRWITQGVPAVNKGRDWGMD
jgi:dipeptidyl aminopeptidase/acylaminoacyl peptidase